MNEDAFNLSVRKFLKQFGVKAQRAIEQAVRGAEEAGTLGGQQRLKARVTLELEGVPLRETVDGVIELV
ncbi:MAG: DUF6494 family protein [Gemmatimonadota bacterium]